MWVLLNQTFGYYEKTKYNITISLRREPSLTEPLGFDGFEARCMHPYTAGTLGLQV